MTFLWKGKRSYTATMSTKPSSAKSSPSRVLCAQCEQVERNCSCDKFCVLCQSELGIRLCTDGLMYCEACRTACDYKPVD